MTDTTFEKLTAMWHAGEIDDEEFKLARNYLRGESVKQRAQQPKPSEPKKEDAGPLSRVAEWALYKIVPMDRLDQWPKLLQSLALLGLAIVIVAVFLFTVYWAAVWALPLLIEADLDADTSLFTAFISTVMILGIAGIFVSFDMRILGVAAIPLFLLILFFPSDDQAPSSTTRPVATRQLSAVEKMEIAFQGGYSRNQIGTLVDATIRNFGSVPTESTREQLSDALVVLRKNVNVQEMEILRCMHAMGPVQIELANAAAICATMLEAN